MFEVLRCDNRFKIHRGLTSAAFCSKEKKKQKNQHKNMSIMTWGLSVNKESFANLKT